MRAVILLAELDGELVIPSAPHPMHLTPSEAALARHAWSRREVVAAESPNERGVYLTLLGSHAPLGVLGLPQGALHQIRKNDQIELLRPAPSNCHRHRASLESQRRAAGPAGGGDRAPAQLTSQCRIARSQDPAHGDPQCWTTLAENDASLDCATRSDLWRPWCRKQSASMGWSSICWP